MKGSLTDGRFIVSGTESGLVKRFEDQHRAALQKSWEIVKAKAPDYDAIHPIWERMPFGVLSWTQEIFVIAERLASLAVGVTTSTAAKDDPLTLQLAAKLEGQLTDLLAYGGMFAAWLRLKQTEE